MADRNPPPKQAFLTDKKAVEAHNQIFSMVEAQRSLNTALLQYQHYLCSQPSADVVICAAQHNRLYGAREFVGILLNLSESAAMPTVERTGNLTHR